MPKVTKETNTKKEKSLISKSTTTKSKSTSKAIINKDLNHSKTMSNSKNSKSTKSISTKKTPSKKSTSKKTSSKVSAKSTKNKKKPINLLEYYDLPYRYNKTIVKVLAQTPKTLFVYWDISDDDRNLYIKQYGENFFNETKPVLVIHNLTMNYTFEIEINDFANCWYFNINDEKCEYSVELGRRSKSINTPIPDNYLYVTSSNKIEAPNGHILFEKNQKSIYYRNVKTKETYSKDIANLEFVQYLGKVHNLHDIYKKVYKTNEFLEIQNPTSKFN